MADDEIDTMECVAELADLKKVELLPLCLFGAGQKNSTLDGDGAVVGGGKRFFLIIVKLFSM